MIKILAVSHAYIEPFTRMGLIDPKHYPEFDSTVVVSAQLARKHPEGFLKLKSEYEKVRTIPTFFNFHQSVRAYSLKLLSLMKENRPDVIFIGNEPWSSTAIQVILFARLLKLRSRIIVYTCENLVRKYPLPFRWLEKYVLKNVDLILSLPKEEGRTVLVEHKKYTGLVQYLPLTVDTTRFMKIESTDVRKRLLGEGDRCIVGFVGRLVKEKGIDLIIRALTELDERYRCVIIGDGPEKDNLMKLAMQLGVENRTTFLGSIFHDQLPEYLNCLDAVILPSLTTSNWKEQFGRILIEAMACEVPVIGSSSGEIPVVISNAGLVFKEGDVKDIADKIRLLGNNKALHQQLGKEGRRRVCELYDARVVMNNTANIYKDLLGYATTH